VKLRLERKKVEASKMEASKMEAQANMMNTMNEASSIALAKMMQEAKILRTDMSGIDPLARAWHEMYHERISKEVMAAQA
jgi:hypothetical protein